jgi:hypothetical protein
MKFDVPKKAISDVIFRLAHRETVSSGILAFHDTKLEFKVVKNDISSFKMHPSNANEHDSC